MRVQKVIHTFLDGLLRLYDFAHFIKKRVDNMIKWRLAHNNIKKGLVAYSEVGVL